jgi:hypothetical protein
LRRIYKKAISGNQIRAEAVVMERAIYLVGDGGSLITKDNVIVNNVIVGIDDTGVSQMTAGIMRFGAGVSRNRVSGNFIQNVAGTAIETPGNFSLVTDNSIDDCATGIKVSQQDSLIENNSIINASVQSVLLDGNVSNSVIRNNIWDIKYGLGTPTGDGYLVTGNTFIGETFFGVTTLVAGTRTVTAAAMDPTISDGRVQIWRTTNGASGTPGILSVTLNPGSDQFTITSSSATDTSQVQWQIIS